MVLLLQAAQVVQDAGSGWDAAREWISTIGSLGAALVAVLAFILSFLGRRERAWAELTHQASRMAAWVDVVEVAPGDGHNVGGRWEDAAVLIHNGSDQPVTECIVTVDLDPDARRLTPASNPLRIRRAVVAPGRTTIREEALPLEGWHKARVFVQFTDTREVRWVRSHAGRLVRVAGPERPAPPTGWRRLLWWRNPFRGLPREQREVLLP